MIKLAAMTSVFPDWDVGEIIEGLQSHGYQGVEPRGEWNHAWGIELDSAAEDREERAGHVRGLEGYIYLAADLGCPFIRTFGGKRGGGELAAIVNYVAEGYRQVMDRAEDRGVNCSSRRTTTGVTARRYGP